VLEPFFAAGRGRRAAGAPGGARGLPAAAE